MDIPPQRVATSEMLDHFTVAVCNGILRSVAFLDRKATRTMALGHTPTVKVVHTRLQETE
jgi:hypothetical protein